MYDKGEFQGDFREDFARPVTFLCGCPAAYLRFMENNAILLQLTKYSAFCCVNFGCINFDIKGKKALKTKVF